MPHPVLKEHEGETYLALRFTRPMWSRGVRYVLETSTDLVNWTDGDLLCEARILTEQIDNEWEIVWVLDDIPIDVFPRRFLRLRLIHYGHPNDRDEMFAFRLLERILADDPGMTILDARYNAHIASAGCFRWGIEHGLIDYVIDPQTGDPVLDPQTGEPEVLWSMDEGIILSSGWASDWNSPEGVGRGHINSQSDEDLENWMVAEGFIHPTWYWSADAASLEIDFSPDHPNLELAFLFGSEEYYQPPDPLNDSMAIFLGELDSNGEI